MLKIENQDWELQQMGKEPIMGYSDEFIEKTMINGRIQRIYKGRRFYASFSYAFLNATERNRIESLLTTQRTQGYVTVQISNPYGNFSGQAIIDLNEDQKRFDKENNTWLNWSISLKSVNLVKD